MKVFLIICLYSLCILSCTHVREYPKCYLFKKPNSGDVSNSNKEISRAIRDTIKTKEIGHTKDSLIVRASSVEHLQLKNIWPAIGCINLRRNPPLTGTINDKWVVARCQEYLADMLNRDKENPPRKRTDVAAAYDEFIAH